MKEEKEYILHFYDGKTRRVTGRLTDLQKLNVARIETSACNIRREEKPMLMQRASGREKTSVRERASELE